MVTLQSILKELLEILESFIYRKITTNVINGIACSTKHKTMREE